ncbi:MAG: glucose-6-phosphate isomerase [Mycoplasmatales bacterium]
MIKLEKKYLKNFLTENWLETNTELVKKIDDKIKNKTGAGNDFLGWYDLPTVYDQVEFDRIKKAAAKIQSDSKILIVIGIGGSYLGAKAVIEFLNDQFKNNHHDETTKIYFAGQNISSTYLYELDQLIGEKDFSINVISKSGTTTEPAIAFRFFKNKLEQKYSEAEVNARIYATTDGTKGALKEQANAYGWESFVVPDNVGGRFSVLTAVGLLPIAAAGIDIDELMLGAREAQTKYQTADLSQNEAYQYAVIRNELHKEGKAIEMLVGYEANQMYFNEWWKQLYGESEGKDGKGIFPASAIFSTDLHSLGQFVQSGTRNLFETVIYFDQVRHEIKVPYDQENRDGLNFLSEMTISEVNQKAFIATVLAHVDGGVPNIVLNVENQSPRSIGHLIYFFELACAMSGYILEVNPFDQPGVEAYKQNMFALLGKPGFEELKAKLERDL